jgi:hypothetical protein
MSAQPDPIAPVFTWGPKELPVPWVAAWSQEHQAAKSLAVKPDGSGLAYLDEMATDRDRHGVLWARLEHAPGAGKPDFRTMHPHRQREAMFHLLCQVCGHPAGRTGAGYLFLFADHQEADVADNHPDSATGGMFTTKPPVCRPCADLALRLCPLLGRPRLVRSRKPRIWGVYGGYFLPDEDGRRLVPTQDAYLAYGRHPTGARWFLASHVVLELTRCT